jgi:hypothetical protein
MRKVTATGLCWSLLKRIKAYAMKIRKSIPVLLILILFSCKSPTERWLNSLAGFKETKDHALTLQAARIKTVIEDTTALNYKVRIYLTSKTAEGRGYDQSLNFNYHMDSCFTVRAEGSDAIPVIIQPVNNGIAHCYEYLLSLEISKAIRLKKLQLVYQDKFIDGKQYIINLN